MQIAVVAACFYLAGGFTSLVTAHAVDGFPQARTDIPTVSFFLGFFVRVSLGFRWAVSDTHDQLLANRAMTNICSLTPNIKTGHSRFTVCVTSRVS